MSDFTAFARDLLARCHIPAKCTECGNPHIDELAITGRGKLICRQDIDVIRTACKERVGWRVLDASGKVVASGPGITLRPTSEMMS